MKMDHPRWWQFKRKRRLRRIADLEAANEIWPPWYYVRKSWYDMHGGSGYVYRLPNNEDICHDWPKPPRIPPPKPKDAKYA